MCSDGSFHRQAAAAGRTGHLAAGQRGWQPASHRFLSPSGFGPIGPRVRTARAGQRYQHLPVTLRSPQAHSPTTTTSNTTRPALLRAREAPDGTSARPYRGEPAQNHGEARALLLVCGHRARYRPPSRRGSAPGLRSCGRRAERPRRSGSCRQAGRRAPQRRAVGPWQRGLGESGSTWGRLARRLRRDERQGR